MMTSEEHIVVIERLTRVEEKLDHLLDRTISHNTRSDAHEGRIRSLETSGAKMLGVSTAVAALAGLAGSKVFDILIGHI
jgi:hypothetical protein